MDHDQRHHVNHPMGLGHHGAGFCPSTIRMLVAGGGHATTREKPIFAGESANVLHATELGIQRATVTLGGLLKYT